MKWDFSENFGTLWNVDNLFCPASNLTELWWDGEMQALLNLHLAAAPKGERIVSDYDRFRFLCERMPYLTKHPVARHCKDFLRRHFACDLPMGENTCAEIWRICADALLVKPRSVAELFSADDPKYLLWNCETLPKKCANGLIPMPTDRILLPKFSVAWQEWLDECTETLDRFGSYECEQVYVELKDDFLFQAPDPYHVGSATAKERRSHGDACILMSQLLRHLSEYCQKNQWTLFLSVGTCGKEAVKLLSYVEGAVGLPSVLWCTNHPFTRDALTTFGTQTHASPVLPIIRFSDYPSDAELSEAIEAYAARYPIDLLHFACGGDLRHAQSEKQRLCTFMLSDYGERKGEE